MRLVSEKTLNYFRARPCEFCGRAPRSQAAHRLTKGIGGGSRIDHPWNLCSLCFECHTKHHNGQHPTAELMLNMIAKREKIDVNQIEKEMYYIAALPKGAKYDWNRIPANNLVHKNQSRFLLSSPASD